MKKAFFIIFILTQMVFANKIKIINNISDIPKNKNIVLTFSMDYCPYCVKQEKDILRYIKPKFKDIEFIKVMRETKVFQKLIETGNFGETQYFPTTFILKINNDNKIDVKYPFAGYQKSSYIIGVLNDKDIMED